MKGIAIVIPIVLVLVLVLLIIGFLYFQKTVFVEKRLLQEKILLNGNRIETTGLLAKQAAELSLLQAIYDIAGSNIAVQNNFEYEPQEKLPYWSDVKQEYIKNSVILLSEKYFEKYHKGFEEYFMNPQTSYGRNEFWKVEWNKNMQIKSLTNDEIKVNFGSYKVTYQDEAVKMEREYALEANVKTKLGKMFEKGNSAVQLINNNRQNQIQSELSDNDVNVYVEQKNNYYVITIEEKKENVFYKIDTNSKEKDKIKLKFVLNVNNRCLCLNSCEQGPCWMTLTQSFYSCPLQTCNIIPYVPIGTPIEDCPKRVLCDGVEVDLCSDRENCGECGNECDGPVDGGFCCNHGLCNDLSGRTCNYESEETYDYRCYCSNSLCTSPCWSGDLNINLCAPNYCGTSSVVGVTLNQLQNIKVYENIYVLKPGEKSDFIFQN
ncbi:MAG: hypothetical protein QXF88_00510 [Candidatus Aenigmatarchaeota archaeon]